MRHVGVTLRNPRQGCQCSTGGRLQQVPSTTQQTRESSTPWFGRVREKPNRTVRYVRGQDADLGLSLTVEESSVVPGTGRSWADLPRAGVNPCIPEG